MRVLILGGTRFVGRALVEAALERGDEVTLFNRGQSHPELFAGQVEQLIGDRDGGLDALDGGRWDVAIDTCGYVSRVVRQSAQLLKDKVEHYTFISSISVYRDPAPHGVDEHAEVIELEDPEVEEVNGQTYGGLKVLCERAVEASLPGRSLIVRAGLIVGPYDTTDRFTYWPWRARQGGRILAPGSPDHPVQWVDVRDLASWVLKASEAKLKGSFNVTGPAQSMTMGSFLATLMRMHDQEAELTWLPESFLVEQHVSPWLHLPMWTGLEAVGMSRVSNARALKAGLELRPLPQTAKDALAWFDAHRAKDKDAMSRSLSLEREQELLAFWDGSEASI